MFKPCLSFHYLIWSYIARVPVLEQLMEWQDGAFEMERAGVLFLGPIATMVTGIGYREYWG